MMGSVGILSAGFGILPKPVIHSAAQGSRKSQYPAPSA